MFRVIAERWRRRSPGGQARRTRSTSRGSMIRPPLGPAAQSSQKSAKRYRPVRTRGTRNRSWPVAFTPVWSRVRQGPDRADDSVARWSEFYATSRRSRETSAEGHRLGGERGRDHQYWLRPPRLRPEIAGRDYGDGLTGTRLRTAQLPYPDVSSASCRQHKRTDESYRKHSDHYETRYAASRARGPHSASGTFGYARPADRSARGCRRLRRPEGRA